MLLENAELIIVIHWSKSLDQTPTEKINGVGSDSSFPFSCQQPNVGVVTHSGRDALPCPYRAEVLISSDKWLGYN